MFTALGPIDRLAMMWGMRRIMLVRVSDALLVEQRGTYKLISFPPA
jgi:hypothetical protein